MNVGLAMTAAPPPTAQPAQIDPAVDDGTFAALFGGQLAAQAEATPGKAAVQSQILIAPAGELAATLTTALKATPEPDASAEADTTIENAAQPEAAPALAALQPPAPLPATAVIEAAVAESDEPVDSNVAGAAHVAAQSKAAPHSPPVLPATAADRAVEVVRDGPAAPASEGSAPAPSTDAAVADVKPAVAAPGTAHGTAPGTAHASATPPPEAAQPKPEILLPARPERLAADVGVEIVRQIGANRSEFTIRLDPPDLGRVDVRIEFNRGEVRAVVTSDNPATHDLLRRDAEGLARMLVDNGFRADSGAFRFDLRQDGGQPRGFAHAGTHQSSQPGAEAAADFIPDTARSTRRGLLDLLA